MSDFRDYYDYWFDSIRSDAPVFRRMVTEGPSRREMFAILARFGLRVPPHGTPEQVLDKLVVPRRVRDDGPCALSGWRPRVVVYEDERAHRGDGKSVVPIDRAVRVYPDRFCAQFVDDCPARPTSLRHFQVGARSFLVRYASDDQWRSNVGDVQVEYLAEIPVAAAPLPYPLYAIDFVAMDDRAYAVDLNLAPQIRGTGVEEHLSAPEAVRLIEEWHGLFATT